jgi:hypothetical protein
MATVKAAPLRMHSRLPDQSKPQLSTGVLRQGRNLRRLADRPNRDSEQCIDSRSRPSSVRLATKLTQLAYSAQCGSTNEELIVVRELHSNRTVRSLLIQINKSRSAHGSMIRSAAECSVAFVQLAGYAMRPEATFGRCAACLFAADRFRAPIRGAAAAALADVEVPPEKAAPAARTATVDRPARGPQRA